MSRLLTLVVCSLVLINSTIAEASRNITFRRINLYSEQLQHSSIREIQELFKTSKTTFAIYGELDLKGGSLSIPERSNVVFKENGSIKNGGITFNDTWLKNPSFRGISRVSGQIRNKEINTSWFQSSDDTQVLHFVLSQQANNIIVNLENRAYEINSLEGVSKVESETAFVRHINQKGLVIRGNGARINDKSSKKAIGDKLYSLMSFDNCKDVSITNLTFHWKEKAELGRYVEGIIFIRTYNECSQFDINIKVENAGRGVYSGRWNNVNGNSRRGLCDSKIVVNAKHVGYPIAIEKGEKLDLEAVYDNVHRGMYLAGVTNARVLIKGKNVVATKVHLLLTDTADSLGCYMCDGIEASVYDTGTGELCNLSQMAIIQFYDSIYSQFKNRQPYKIEDIKIHVYTTATEGTGYEVFQFAGTPIEGDIIHVEIDGELNHKGGDNRLLRLNKLPQGTISVSGLTMPSNVITYNQDIPDNCKVRISNCKDIFFEHRSQKAVIGSEIVFDNCSFSYIREKESNLPYYVPIVVNGRLADFK